jgi:uncharacterized lipoprotein YajG
MNPPTLAHRALTALLLAASLLAGCSDTVVPTPAVAPPAASASDTSQQSSLVGTVPAAPASDAAAANAGANTDLTQAQQSSAMPLPGQANDHSTTSPKASQKANTTP